MKLIAHRFFRKSKIEAVWPHTIAQVPTKSISSLRSLTVEHKNAVPIKDSLLSQQEIKIRFANTEEKRVATSILVDKRYSWRGYSGNLPERPVESITLMATAEDKSTIGTLTMSFDSPAGLLADSLYKEYIDPLRKEGRKIFEITKLAVDSNNSSRGVLASLFHIAYAYGRFINNYTDLLIEVNPRHMGFYERMLGFKKCGEQRICPRVSAPAVLMRLELDYVDGKVREQAGKQPSVGDKSLYYYFFTKQEEVDFIRRLTGDRGKTRIAA